MQMLLHNQCVRNVEQHKLHNNNVLLIFKKL